MTDGGSAAPVSVLVLSPWPLPAAGRATPGAAARAYELARALGRAGLRTTLATPAAGDPVPEAEVLVLPAGAPLPEGHDACVLPWGVFGDAASPQPRGLVVVDAYDPSLLNYALRDAADASGRTDYEERLHRLASALLAADVVLAGGRPVRHFLLGMLALLGRVAPGRPDPGDDLLDVPLGAPPAPQREFDPLVVEPALPRDAETVLWPGGAHVFLDAERALRAFEVVAARRPRAHLLVAGGVGPKGARADRESFERLAAAARASPFAGRVRFAPWTPYPERGRIYAAADVALVLSRSGAEDELAWRNRIVDALWGGLPVVCDGESELAARVESAGAGRRTSRETEAAARAVEEFLADPGERRRASDAARRLAAGPLSWDTLAAPLAARLMRGGPGLPSERVPALRLRRARWGTPFHRAEVSLRMRGPAGFVGHALRRAAGGRQPPEPPSHSSRSEL